MKWLLISLLFTIANFVLKFSCSLPTNLGIIDNLSRDVSSINFLLSNIQNQSASYLSESDVTTVSSQLDLQEPDFNVPWIGYNTTTELNTLELAFSNSSQTALVSEYVGLQSFDPESCDNQPIVIRKCCEITQFMNGSTCEDGINTQVLQELVDKVLGKNSTYVNIQSGLISCSSSTPLIISGDDIQFLKVASCLGDVLDIRDNVLYNAQNYCAEIWQTENDYEFLVAVCEKPPTLSIVRKCCPSETMYDYDFNCMPLLKYNEQGFDNVLTHSASVYKLEYSNEMLCDTWLSNCSFDDFTINELGHLCPQNKTQCYDQNHYCIENQYNDNNTIYSKALVCPAVGFIKCCNLGQVLVNHECTNSTFVSHYMASLMQTHLYRINPHSQLTKYIPQTLYWNITYDGNLLINCDYTNDQVVIDKYCIEDVLTENGNFITLAYTSISELFNVLPLPIESFTNAVPKCCKPDESLEIQDIQITCTSVASTLSIIEELAINASGTVYTAVPICSSDTYHAYPVYENHISRSTEVLDHVVIQADLSAVVYSYDDTCIDSETNIPKRKYCLDFGQPEGLPYAIICTNTSKTIRLPNEVVSRYLSVLMIISSILLIICAYFLMTTRVWSGHIMVNKMHTLAGKNYSCYILATIVGFLNFSITNKVRIQDGFSGCTALAGISLYFLLAGFFWNSIICIDSLVLTIYGPFGNSNRRLFLMYSLGAWGIPALITITALLLDYFRHQLPCNTIVPRFGRDSCFFADKSSEAQMLLFYLPIGVTICINIYCLLKSRQIRAVNLSSFGKAKSARKDNQSTKVISKKETPINNPQQGDISSKANGASTLRVHQQQSRYKDALRLALSSASFWIFEIISFAVSKYTYQHQSLHLLWIIPSTINALKGMVIFFIIMSTPESKKRLKFATVRIRSKMSEWRSSTQKSNQKPLNSGCANYPAFRHGSYSLEASERRSSVLSEVLSSILTFRSSLSSLPNPTIFGSFMYLKEGGTCPLSNDLDSIKRETVTSSSISLSDGRKISFQSILEMDEILTTGVSQSVSTD